MLLAPSHRPTMIRRKWQLTLGDPSRPGCRPADRHDERIGVMADGRSDWHRGSISERIYLSTTTPPPAVFHSQVLGRSRRLTSVSNTAVPIALWPVVAARVAAGESLRALGREYGVSHECVRRIAQTAGSASTATVRQTRLREASGMESA